MLERIQSIIIIIIATIAYQTCSYVDFNYYYGNLREIYFLVELSECIR